GGGEGKGKGNHPMTPWGKPTKGYKPRRGARPSDRDIVRRRKNEVAAVGRPRKRGPHIEETLLARVEELNRTRQKKVLKAWSRRATSAPELVGHTLAVHHGKKFSRVHATQNMARHRSDRNWMRSTRKADWSYLRA